MQISAPVQRYSGIGEWYNIIGTGTVAKSELLSSPREQAPISSPSPIDPKRSGPTFLQ
jgi:hypothetical protein